MASFAGKANVALGNEGMSATMWRSKASSTFTLLLTLAMINYYSNPLSTADGGNASKSDRVRSGSKSKPRVDMVRERIRAITHDTTGSMSVAIIQGW